MLRVACEDKADRKMYEWMDIFLTEKGPCGWKSWPKIVTSRWSTFGTPPRRSLTFPSSLCVPCDWLAGCPLGQRGSENGWMDEWIIIIYLCVKVLKTLTFCKIKKNWLRYCWFLSGVVQEVRRGGGAHHKAFMLMALKWLVHVSKTTH